VGSGRGFAETGKDREVWGELQRQLDAKGLRVRKGVVQDASFITADPGHARAGTPRGTEAKTRRSRDGSWTKKGNRSYFGYKQGSRMLRWIMVEAAWVAVRHDERMREFYERVKRRRGKAIVAVA